MINDPGTSIRLVGEGVKELDEGDTGTGTGEASTQGWAIGVAGAENGSGTGGELAVAGAMYSGGTAGATNAGGAKSSSSSGGAHGTAPAPDIGVGA
jgi:hypothetical protein